MDDKNLQDLENQLQKRAKKGMRASVMGIIVNACLAFSKITIGLLSGTVSIIADGVNNLSDTGVVLVSVISLHMSQKPEDRDHPFGHGRIEYIGLLIISALILIMGAELLRSSIGALITPSIPEFSLWMMLVVAISIPVKLGMWLYYRSIGKEFQIDTMMALAQDSINDVLMTLSILIGLLIGRYLNFAVDAYLGLVVSLVILWSGIKIVRNTVNDLIGGRPNHELGEKILMIIRKYPQIIGTHDFILHDYGPGRSIASIHAEVDGKSNLIEIHEIIDQAEQEISAELRIPICIHIDPVIQDEKTNSIETQLKLFLQDYNPPIRMHDFRIVPGKQTVKLIFDVEIPAEFHQETQLKQDIDAFARGIDPRFQSLVHIDRDYFQ